MALIRLLVLKAGCADGAGALMVLTALMVLA